MKTQRFSKKRYSKLPLLLALLMVLSACGKKSSDKNEVQSLNNNNNRYGGYPGGNLGGYAGNALSQLSGQIQCAQGYDGTNTYTGRRLSQVVTFSVPASNYSGNSTAIEHYGPMQQGAMGSGGNEVFVGTSTFGDILIVEKVGSGFNVQGYNYSISFCEVVVQSGGYYSQQMQVPVISDQNQVVQMTNDSPTILDYQTCQGFGMIDQADITAYFQVNSGGTYGGYNNAIPMATTFFPLNECNGGYGGYYGY